jgi:hypothetical protein
MDVFTSLADILAAALPASAPPCTSPSTARPSDAYDAPTSVPVDEDRNTGLGNWGNGSGAYCVVA